jgi:hypothetical protein
MDTLTAFRLFCDGQTSVSNIFALLGSIGHSREDLRAAMMTVIEGEHSIRYRDGGKDDYLGELFISVT